MTQSAWGLLAVLATATIWGLSGLFYKELSHVPPLEVLAHRTIWSVLFFLIVLACQRRFGELGGWLQNWHVLRRILLSATLIAINWCVFIVAVQTGHALDASFGYYIFPLLALALGYLLLGERFSRFQGVAILIALVAVIFLGIGLGVTPWIALLLAVSFGFYGLIKNQLEIGPVMSVTLETVLLSPLALLWLWGAHHDGWILLSTAQPGQFAHDWRTSLLLITSGPLTAIPLVMLSFGAQRVRYGTLGLVAYLNPTLQFVVAVMVFGEPFTDAHLVAFAMIWAAVIVFSLEGLRQERSLSRSRRAGTSSTNSK